ncbi:hypothetical protein Droror1_Dr00011194 [Drosera rotundifolia]
MPKPTPFLFTLILLLAAPSISGQGRRRHHIPDDLDDIIDDEEDESWINWGGANKQQPPQMPEPADISPEEFEKMDAAQIAAEMARRNVGIGSAVGFVKLRFGVGRTPESVSEMAVKWTRLLKLGGIEIKFMGIDLSTIMFTLQRPKDVEELKDFILDQPDAYEVKIGDQAFRRPGDPPLEEVIETLRSERDKVSEGFFKNEEAHDEL